jgi:alpha-L-glutamate ligase-like protein
MRSRVTKLRSAGVLGLNQRNADYISRYNQRKFYPLVDDKLRSKELAIGAGIAVPPLYATLRFPSEIQRFSERIGDLQEFVIKPAHGSGGEGIIVVTGRTKSAYRLIDGRLYTEEDIAHHLLNILGGMYSLGGHPDSVIIEYRVNFDPIFEPISYRGVPDIRMIVFLGVPVMSMIRLPTLASGGRANLHQGAIGCGVDTATGVTMSAVWGNSIIQEHPDTGAPLRGIVIPYWDTMLSLASRSYELTGLGYQGVDFVIDAHRGPLVLEFNARPGLNIQLANLSGLIPRLTLVEDSLVSLTDSTARVSFAKTKFASQSGASHESPI